MKFPKCNIKSDNNGFTTEKPYLCIIGSCDINSTATDIIIDYLYPYTVEYKDKNSNEIIQWKAWYDKYNNKFVSSIISEDMENPYNYFVIKYYDNDNPMDKDEIDIINNFYNYSNDYKKGRNYDNGNEQIYPLLDKRDYPRCEVFNKKENVYNSNLSYPCLLSNVDKDINTLRIIDLYPNYQPAKINCKKTKNNFPWYSWCDNDGDILSHYKNSFDDRESVISWFDKNKEEDKKEYELIQGFFNERIAILADIFSKKIN